MSIDNPFDQSTSIRSKSDDGEGQGGPKVLKSRPKNVSPETLSRVDKVSVSTGWATDDERSATETPKPAPERIVQLGVRVGEPYVTRLNEICHEKRQTKRVVIEQALEAYCELHGLSPITNEE